MAVQISSFLPHQPCHHVSPRIPTTMSFHGRYKAILVLRINNTTKTRSSFLRLLSSPVLCFASFSPARVGSVPSATKTPQHGGENGGFRHRCQAPERHPVPRGCRHEVSTTGPKIDWLGGRRSACFGSWRKPSLAYDDHVFRADVENLYLILWTSLYRVDEETPITHALEPPDTDRHRRERIVTGVRTGRGPRGPRIEMRIRERRAMSWRKHRNKHMVFTHLI